MLGKYESAIEDFNACLNVNPDLVDGWLGLGLANEKKGDKEAAKEAYNRALAVDMSNATAKEALARLSGDANSGGGLFGKKLF